MNLIHGGHPTIYVSNMDRAIAFYTETLGLKLAFHAGDHYAKIDAGDGLIVGLHPAGQDSPTPGASGGITLTLVVTKSLEDVVRKLEERGVRFPTAIKSDGPVRIVGFEDLDGNAMWLCEQSKSQA
jgi:catechol 2,3-dioxygenase-like lactoylglutathione lyase family enzyme